MSFDSQVLSPRNPRSPDGLSLLSTNNQAQQSTLNAIQVATAQPADPTGTTSTTGVMMGLSQVFTPTKTGRLKVTVQYIANQNTTADGTTAQIAQGTGTAPVNGAAATGTLKGQPSTMTFLTGVLAVPDVLVAIITGLTLNTAVWIDVNLKAVTGGTASITKVNVIIEEY